MCICYTSLTFGVYFLTAQELFAPCVVLLTKLNLQVLLTAKALQPPQAPRVLFYVNEFGS